jgi:hypothetical protein
LNLHPFVLEALQRTPYYRKVLSISRFADLFVEMEKISHLEPFEPDRTASVAFCLLFRAMQLKLSRKQMELLLSPQVRLFIPVFT